MGKRLSSWFRRGNLFVWGSGGVLALGLLMIFGLIGLIVVRASAAFWPAPLVQITTPEGPVLGEQVGEETATHEDSAKLQFRVGNRDIYGQDFRWIEASAISEKSYPLKAAVIERQEGGQFLGFVARVTQEGRSLAEGDSTAAALSELLPGAKQLAKQVRVLEKDRVGRLNAELEEVQTDRNTREGKGLSVSDLDTKEASLRNAFTALQTELDTLRAKAEAVKVTLQTVDGKEKEIPLSAVVRVTYPNAQGPIGKMGTLLARVWEFLSADPREANTEGGVFPAIFGTVMMVILMSILVVPLGVMAALYLREYAKDGLLLRMVRVAVNNLAGVPSIVFGVFGLGFFVYTLGGSLDALFFSNKLPTPTFGTGGILWASLTLALLTVPVVIVATEEAIATVPRSLREASLALGATKWQTIRNVVIPGAMPGILTGLILAMARGAGEVAPLMLTGVVKLAPSLPVDGQFPFMHLDRKFMHLGFSIYDTGFQSPNSEAAKPMVFMTTLLLLAVVVVLNLFALRLRTRLRAKLGGSTF
jgi:phosphate transport system permease protein